MRRTPSGSAHVRACGDEGEGEGEGAKERRGNWQQCKGKKESWRVNGTKLTSDGAMERGSEGAGETECRWEGE